MMMKMHIHVIAPWFIRNSILILLSLAFIVSSDSPQYEGKSCQEKKTYISGSAFETNLNGTLFTQLLPKASTIKFSNHTIGLGEDQVYGLFYCKGDVDDQTCQSCVEAATRKIKDVCEFSKEGIVWFQECTLRYADRNIFSISERSPYFSPLNNTGIVNNYHLDPYKETFNKAMEALIQEAANDKSFSTNEINVSSTGKIRGLAQCTPDIVGPGCYKCLSTALGLRDSWANTMMFLPSCLFRYDLYGTVQPPAPTPPPPSHIQRVPALYIALIVVLPVVFIVLAVIGGPRLWKRCLKGHSRPVGQTSSPVGVGNGDNRVHRLPKYTYSQLEQMTNGFETRIGKGGFGEVFHGRLLDGSREVAVKKLLENDAPTQFSNEINVFVRISHNNLVSLLGYCEDETRLALVYEYMDNGDLKALLTQKADSLSWSDRLKIAIDTAEGLHYLHKKCEVRIVHRDVKPANILLNENLQAKVADFGLSKIFEEDDVTTILTRVIGTRGYKAPEYSMTGLLTDKADVYSFGVVLLELITGKAPRAGSDLVESFINIFNAGDIEQALDDRVKRATEQQTLQGPNYSSVWEAAELAKQCVEEVATERPNMWDIVVKLKECLDMEVKKNAGNYRTGLTSMGIMSPLVSGSLTMGPEVR